MTTLSKKGHLPVSRINTIMKSSSDVDTVGKTAGLMMCKAAEIFIKMLTQEAYEISGNAKKLDYKHLTDIVHSDEKYNFLRDIMPKKITFGEYKKILERKQGSNENEEKDKHSSSSSSDDDSSSEESDGSSASA